MRNKSRNVICSRGSGGFSSLQAFWQFLFSFQTSTKLHLHFRFWMQCTRNLKQMSLAWALAKQSHVHMLWKPMCGVPPACAPERYTLVYWKDCIMCSWHKGHFWYDSCETVRCRELLEWRWWKQRIVKPEKSKGPPSIPLLAVEGGGSRKQVVPHKQDRCVATLSTDFSCSCKALIFKVTLHSHSFCLISPLSSSFRGLLVLPKAP